MNVVIGAKTDPGRRSNNEDHFSILDVRRHRLWADGVLVIADGMGGRQWGERASAAAVETVQDTLVEMLAASRAAQTDTGEALESALRKANARVYEMSRQGKEGRGMGTTCVAAVVQDHALFVAHAGDSRAYLMREGRLRQLTDDHSYVAEQVRAGAITEESARRSRFRNVITRAVGIEPAIDPDVARYDISPGDLLLLCTDGLTNMVSEDDIGQTLQYAPTPQAAADRLIQLATRAGGKDNITAVVARFEVDNRTAQMRAEDLAPVSEADVEDVPPARPAKQAGPVRQARPIALIVAGILILLLAGLSSVLLHVLLRDGYTLRAAPPFVARPAPPAKTAPHLDLAHLTYNAPVPLYLKPVQGGFLSLNPSDGSLMAVTLHGNQVLKVSPTGAVLSLSPPPTKAQAASRPVFPADSNQHYATDAQGDIYIARAGNRDIVKYGPDLTPLGHISGLNSPGALAVAADGTIYVIDGETLKVIRPMTAP